MKHILTARRRVALALLMPGFLAAQATTKLVAPQAPNPGSAQTGHIFIKYADRFLKWKGELSNVGLLNGSPVFKNARGEFFTVEPSTGDLKFHTAESLGFLKLGPSARGFMKFDAIKGETKLSIAGLDAQGRVVQENSRGEKFVLGPNGDMEFVK
jgi:hypothetical protein